MPLKNELHNKIVSRDTAKAVLRALTVEIKKDANGKLVSIDVPRKQLPRVNRQLLVMVPQTQETVFIHNLGYRVDGKDAFKLYVRDFA